MESKNEKKEVKCCGFHGDNGKTMDKETGFHRNNGKNIDKETGFHSNNGNNIDKETGFHSNNGKIIDKEKGFHGNNSNNIDKETANLVLQKLREEVTEKVRRDLDDLFDAFVSDVEQISQSSTVQNGSLQLSSAINR